MRVHWLSPGDPGQRTGGYLYNAAIIDGLRALGHDVTVHALPGAWPWPGEADLTACREALGRVDSGEPVVADGLLWTGLGDEGQALASRCPVTVLLHSPLHVEASDPTWVRQAERAALQGVRRVVTSPRTSDDLGLDAALVVPGTDRPDRARIVARPPREEVVLLCVATLTARKGHDVLLDALATIPDRPWRLRCAGDPRDPAVAARLAAQIEALGLSSRVELLGDLGPDALEAAYADADVLVHVARYEAWGMALTEALARGLPVISTPAGALDGLPADAWLSVPPGDAGALAQAVAGVLDDPARRERLREAALSAASGFPTWSEQARRFAAILQDRATPILGSDRVRVLQAQREAPGADGVRNGFAADRPAPEPHAGDDAPGAASPRIDRRIP